MSRRELELRVEADLAAVVAAAAEEFLRVSREAVQRAGHATVLLAGGGTPRTLYELLAGQLRDQVDWADIHFFWGDERHVAPDHTDNNFRMANAAMLSRVPLPPGNIHRIRSESADASAAAKEYQEELVRFFGVAPPMFPTFDLALLGMGPDGHTASLFPGTTALAERERWVASLWVDKFQTYRITVTAPVLNEASHVVFLVCGADKADTLCAVLKGPHEPLRLPSQLIRPTHGCLLWLVDSAAGAKL